MKRLITIAITAIALIHVTSVLASSTPVAEVKSAKGPVQITFRLYKTKVKTERNLWYTLELKNVGKKKLRVDDWAFKDPWAMAQNCRRRFGIYLEILDPKGEPLEVRPGGDAPHFNWEPKGDEVLPYTEKEKQEIAALRAKGNKRGLTAQQQSLALNDWNNKNNAKKNMAELSDPANQLWLEPGASTSTVAWMDRGPGEYAERSEDDAALSKGYTQLWSYDFYKSGTYRIRAIYNQTQSASTRALFKKHGQKAGYGWVQVKTPFIEFEVSP
jgi:hypothetical protein